MYHVKTHFPLENLLLNTQWSSEPRFPVSHKPPSHSRGIRLKVFSHMEAKKRIQFCCWRDFGGNKTSFFPFSEEGKAIKEVMNVWSYWQKQIFKNTF